MLQVREVTKTYDGRAVVDRVTFEVQPGEVFALLGPNGAGKTTLIRMITDILRPDSGQILLDGNPVDGEARHSIAYLPEERGLYRRSRVIDVLAYYGELKGLAPREARKTARTLLDRVDLGEWIDKQVQALSKGMQQKVQLCTALIGEPRLMILDEPFTGLDPLNVQLFEEILHERRARGTTVLLSTHQMNKVEEVCDRALMMNRGRMVLYGAVRELRRRHADHAVVVRTNDSLAGLPGVRDSRSANGEHVLTLEPQATSDQVLAAFDQRGQHLVGGGLGLESQHVLSVRGPGIPHPWEPGQRIIGADHDGVVGVAAAQLTHRAVEHHAAAIHHQRPVANFLHLVHLVGGEEHRRPARPALVEDLLEQLNVERIEAGEGLVENHQSRLSDQGGAQLDLLLHSLRERLDLLVDPLPEIDPIQQRPGGLARLARRQTFELAVVRQHIDHPGAPVEAAFLGKVGDRVAGLAIDRVSVEQNLARIRPEDVGNHADEGGLSRAIGSEQGEDLSGLDFERHPIDDRTAIVGLGDFPNLKHAHLEGSEGSEERGRS